MRLPGRARSAVRRQCGGREPSRQQQRWEGRRTRAPGVAAISSSPPPRPRPAPHSRPPRCTGSEGCRLTNAHWTSPPPDAGQMPPALAEQQLDPCAGQPARYKRQPLQPQWPECGGSANKRGDSSSSVDGRPTPPSLATTARVARSATRRLPAAGRREGHYSYRARQSSPGRRRHRVEKMAAANGSPAAVAFPARPLLKCRPAPAPPPPARPLPPPSSGAHTPPDTLPPGLGGAYRAVGGPPLAAHRRHTGQRRPPSRAPDAAGGSPGGPTIPETGVVIGSVAWGTAGRGGRTVRARRLRAAAGRALLSTAGGGGGQCRPPRPGDGRVKGHGRARPPRAARFTGQHVN